MDLFGTAGIRGPVRDRVTPGLALSVGQALGSYIRDVETDVVPTVVLGWDGRETSESLVAAVESGVTSAGVDVLRVGELPTPALAFCSQGRYGVMITASHNPPTDNGIKLFEDGEEFDSGAEGEIERLVTETGEPAAWNEFGTSGLADELGTYRDRIAEYAVETLGVDNDEPLTGVSVVVDCGNGVASLATPQVLRALGAHVVTLNANVDGTFPGRESKPTPETLTDLRTFIRDGEFDMGIGHDGDGDRIVIVGPGGDVVHEDTILAVLARHYVADSESEDPVVVTTPNASARIDEVVREERGRTERVRLGALHEGIARERDAGTGETDVVFAAEPWKHIHTALGGWIDGVASAAVLTGLVASAGDVATLVEPITERPYRKISVPCPDAAKTPAMERIGRELPDQFPDGDVSTEYGVRIELPDASWVLVRPSGTEEYVRFYAESDDIDRIVETTRAVVADAIEASR
ncbi:phosphomannomutase [Natranaeroarchaeum sulfidigenes]|uniref:Phosphomannomutase n=1 Tax=Natranaeroarchaeum sulfidigenes TaxID=2784880 RepID=A0A897MWW7_9EURY|nr:phosphomannomutase [Natranaeroarchaeum sulfidigenes]QSG02656.1 Phosphomannomutase [Natranaeroarchaeum sulfidigenes]